jgi:signal transduction histidine kinase
MASLGELVAGIAHELNTPMGAINSNTQMVNRGLEKLRVSLSSDDVERKRSEDVIDQIDTLNQVNRGACQRMIKIVDSLRSFARLDEAEWKLADLNQGIDDTLSLIQHKLKDRIRVLKEYGDLQEVACYPRQLNQVFMILLVNAVQAIEGEGEIEIHTYPENGNAVVKIKDNGRGIPPEIVGRIFDPGFTTKGVGVGTGLGLSICYQIIDKHKGRIEVDSGVGKGSTFTLAIPIQQEPT